jgi:hypothetical protein
VNGIVERRACSLGSVYAGELASFATWSSLSGLERVELERVRMERVGLETLGGQ